MQVPRAASMCANAGFSRRVLSSTCSGMQTGMRVVHQHARCQPSQLQPAAPALPRPSCGGTRTRRQPLAAMREAPAGSAQQQQQQQQPPGGGGGDPRSRSPGGSDDGAEPQPPGNDSRKWWRQLMRDMGEVAPAFQTFVSAAAALWATMQLLLLPMSGKLEEVKTDVNKLSTSLEKLEVKLDGKLDMLEVKLDVKLDKLNDDIKQLIEAVAQLQRRK